MQQAHSLESLPYVNEHTTNPAALEPVGTANLTERSTWDFCGSLFSWKGLMLSDTVLIPFIHWLETFGLNDCSWGAAKLQWKSDSTPQKAMFGLETRTRDWSYKQSWLEIFQQNRSFIWFIVTKSVCRNMRGPGWLCLTQASAPSFCFLSLSFVHWIFNYQHKMK